MSDERDAVCGLVAIVYELLDAHYDTEALAGELRDRFEWAAHLDYLRDLQRVSREAMARLTPDVRNSGPVSAQRRLSAM
jgi:hypothetical protein